MLFNFFGKSLEEAEKELEGLKKAYEILNDRYKKKTITCLPNSLDNLKKYYML